jgi:N-acetylmuramoyl-L-alanine amidase
MLKNLIMLSIILFVVEKSPAMGSKPIPPNSLNELSINYGLPEPARKNKQFIIKNQNISLTFIENSRRLRVNNILVMMNGPLTIKNKYAFLEPIDITDTLIPLLSPEKLLNKQIKTIILDPGHGGSDPGTVGTKGSKEKDIVLDIAKRCQKKLQAMGIKVIMTRSKDKAVNLKARPKVAEKSKADFFISIHVNSSCNHAANGIETHILPASGFPCTSPSHLSKKACKGNKDNKTSVLLSYSIHKATLATALAADRGIKRSRFSVLRNSTCPAILIECGFLSNQAEEKKLTTPAYREKIATGIANGIKSLINIQKQ